MKTFMSFGVPSLMVSGQKTAVVNAEPQLIVSCTTGKFVITSPVSKALNIAPGERIMFLNDFIQVEEAIMARNKDIVEYAANNGIDIDSPAGVSELISIFGHYYIAKSNSEKNGSKTATTSEATGVGCKLDFTDTAIWNQMKRDLGEDKKKKNRIFDVLLDNGIRNEELGITYYPIEYKEDVDVVSRGVKED